MPAKRPSSQPAVEDVAMEPGEASGIEHKPEFLGIFTNFVDSRFFPPVQSLPKEEFPELVSELESELETITRLEKLITTANENAVIAERQRIDEFVAKWGPRALSTGAPPPRPKREEEDSELGDAGLLDLAGIFSAAITAYEARSEPLALAESGAMITREPGYARPTVSASSRTAGVVPIPFSEKSSIESRKHIRKDTNSQLEAWHRATEEKTLERMNTRVKYLRGVGDISISINPNTVDIQVHERVLYVTHMTIVNEGSTAVRILPVPPSRPGWTVSELCYPGDSSLVAPGMSLQFDLDFFTEYVEAHETEMQIRVQGKEFSIPLSVCEAEDTDDEENSEIFVDDSRRFSGSDD